MCNPSIAIVRGKYLNNFEMQNYKPLAKRFDMTAFASLFPIHEDIGFKVKKLFSPVDGPDFPYKLPILNRLMIDAMYLAGLEKSLKGFDLVCARETYFHFTKQVLDAKKQGIAKKVLVTCSETIPFNHEGIRGRKKFKKRAINEVDHFHCLTQKAKNCLIAEGADSDKISVIGYGIDLKRFKPATLNQHSEIRILFVGRVEEQKGIGDFIKIYPKLKLKFPKLELQVVGKGPLESDVKKAGGKIISLPYLKIQKAYQKADIFVLPSKPTRYWEEYYGMALLEAMACGLPIVTTNCGAIPEVVGDSADVVPHSKVEPLYDGVRKLIKNEGLRKKLGQKARKRAEIYFDCQKQSKKLGNLWQSLLLKE